MKKLGARNSIHCAVSTQMGKRIQLDGCRWLFTDYFQKSANSLRDKTLCLIELYNKR